VLMCVHKPARPIPLSDPEGLAKCDGGGPRPDPAHETHVGHDNPRWHRRSAGIRTRKVRT
jgi:hypothetical protein